MPPTDVGLAVLELLLLGLLLSQFELVQLGLEHRHRFSAVAMLRAIVLALDDDAGGEMRHPHRRIGLVDVLSAGAAGAEGVDAEVGRIDLDLDRFVDFGIDEHARERRVPSIARIERRFANEPMDTGLGAQMTVRVFASDLDRCALEARDFAGRFLEQLRRVALAFGVARVHPIQHLCPVLRLGATRARVDIHEAAAGVEWMVEHPLEFELGDGFLDRCGIA